MEITEIKTNELKHHPNNPRESYDDIAELTASIKEQGILQPLTVRKIPAGGYSVIAGNRRMEAAKAAGLDMVPCIITEMSEKDQAAVILIENMQRKNLNPYEEARGVQMCLDLGISEADLAKKTGFSKETIRHRKKLAELDPEKLKKKCSDGQISIQDLISLEKIKDLETRNKVLEFVGTNNFNWKLTEAISSETAEEERKQAYDILSSFAEEMPTDWADSAYRQVEYSITGKYEIPEDAHETDYAFKLTWSGGKTYSLWKLREDVEDEDEPEVSEYELNRRKEEEAKRKLDDLGETFFKMRKEFMKTRGSKFDGNILNWLAYVLLCDDLDDLDDLDESRDAFPYNATLGIPHIDLFPEIYYEEEEVEDPAAYILKNLIKESGSKGLKSNPPDAAVTLVYVFLETGSRIGCKNWHGEFDEEDDSYQRLYDFMELCGYQISDGERKILTGEHEYYKKEED